jgi:hypothetical protein
MSNTRRSTSPFAVGQEVEDLEAPAVRESLPQMGELVEKDHLASARACSYGCSQIGIHRRRQWLARRPST